MNIGITLGLQSEYESMWINGIKLNAILLANALMQIKEHNVYLVDTSNKIEKCPSDKSNNLPNKNFFYISIPNI